MYKKGDNVLITKHVLPKLPKVKDIQNNRFRVSLIRGTAICANDKQVKTHLLPGIGTFVIDTPKDKELSARQRCFRYQEAHRGVTRSKIKPVPEIPKRCGMRNLPIVQLKDMNAKGTEATAPASRRHTPDGSQDRTYSPFLESVASQPEERCDKTRKTEAPLKIPSQDELVSRSPLSRIVQNNGENSASPVVVNGFGVRRSKTVVQPTSCSTSSSSSSPFSKQNMATGRREFTNLTSNLPLAEPEPVAPCKATDRELESQAEYRKQLTFYLSQIFEGEHHDRKEGGSREPGASGHDGNEEGEEDGNGSVYVNIPADNVGHTSKHHDWENSISLGQMLINTTPDLRKRLRVDLKARETGSGRSCCGIRAVNGTPEVTSKHGEKHRAARCQESPLTKNCRPADEGNSINIKYDDNHSNNHNNNNNNNKNSNDYDRVNTNSDDAKSLLPPKRRPSKEHTRNTNTNTNSADRKRDQELNKNGAKKANDKRESPHRLIQDIGANEDKNVDDVDDDNYDQYDDSDGGEDNNDNDYENDGYDQFDLVIDEKWLHMVNTPVVESGVYDRYANVKLPPTWMQPALNTPSGMRNSPVRAGVNHASTNRGAVSGACPVGGGGATSLLLNSGKTVLPDRKYAGRVK